MTLPNLDLRALAVDTSIPWNVDNIHKSSIMVAYS